MLIEGKFTMKAPIQEVWDFLLEPGTLASCIPGAEKMEPIDDKTWEGVVKQKVGPISVKINFTQTLTEVDPPKHVKAVGRGRCRHLHPGDHCRPDRACQGRGGGSLSLKCEHGWPAGYLRREDNASQGQQGW